MDSTSDDEDSSFFVYNKGAALAQEVEHRRGKEEGPSSNLGSSFYRKFY